MEVAKGNRNTLQLHQRWEPMEEKNLEGGIHIHGNRFLVYDCAN